jgi:ribosome-binding factor A
MAQELSQRQLRVGQEIKKVIASTIEKGEVRSPEISEAFITITNVIMSPDLKYATVYIMTLNGKNLGIVLEQLNAEKWIFKKQVASKLKLRFTPDINFRVDDTFDEADRINRLMHDPKVMADLAKPVENEEDE